MPYLQKTNIIECVKIRFDDAVDMGKRKIDIVQEILEVKCALQITGIKDTSRSFVMKHPKTTILYEIPKLKVICIYRIQVFHATQNETQETKIE